MTSKDHTQAEVTAHLDISTMRHIIQLAGSDFEVFFYTVAIEAAKLVGADGAALVLEDTDGEMRYKFFYGLPEVFQKRISDFRADRNSGTIAHALTQGQAIFSADYAASPDAVAEFVEFGLKADWVIPFGVGDSQRPTVVLAISWFNSYPTRIPDATQLEIVHLYCDLIHAGLSRQAMIDDWRNQANRDALTGLPNRRALMEYLPLALERALRNRQSVVVCVIDVDDFKPVNDTYGHAAGDTLLMELAYRFKSVLRTCDMVARLGGDEFVLVLENIESIPHMQAAINRILVVLTQPFEVLDGDFLTIGVSLGVTIFPQDDSPPDYLLRHADNALYTIKERKDTRSTCWYLWHPSIQKI